MQGVIFPKTKGVYFILQRMKKPFFRTLKSLGLAAAAVSAIAANAAYYSTLPEGVRVAVFRQVMTSTIDQEFSSNSKPIGFDVDVNLSAQTLRDTSTIAEYIFSELQNISQFAYDTFTFGTYKIDGKAEVNVQGFGFGYGINDRVTTYVSMPIYNARVDMSMKRTGADTQQQVLNIIQSSPSNSQFHQTFQEFLTGSNINVTEGLIQSVVTNMYSYKPLGTWEARGLGDIDIATIIRLTDWQDAGMALTYGLTLPTGREDDPDLLQDFAFGDGQYDLFAEFGGGKTLMRGKLDLESSLRYTYQVGSNKEMRVPEDENFVLSDQKGTFYEKLGNKIDFMAGANWTFNDSWSLGTQYLFNHIGEAKYESPYTKANSIHAKDTEVYSHTFRVGGNFSTVGMYQRGAFLLPMQASLSAQRIFAGTNTPTYTRFDFEVRFFF